MRLRRMLIGMSQERLGELLGLTFQQVQKYEKGTNRIGASRLFEIARHLGVNVQFFYEDVAEGIPSRNAAGFAEVNESSSNLLSFVTTQEGIELNRAYARITDPLVKRKILDLLRAIGGERTEAEGGEGKKARTAN